MLVIDLILDAYKTCENAAHLLQHTTTARQLRELQLGVL